MPPHAYASSSRLIDEDKNFGSNFFFTHDGDSLQQCWKWTTKKLLNILKHYPFKKNALHATNESVSNHGQFGWSWCNRCVKGQQLIQLTRGLVNFNYVIPVYESSHRCVWRTSSISQRSCIS